MTHMDFLKKFKRFNPLESSLTILGFFFLSILFFIGCFFYVDYKSILLHSKGTKLFSFHFSSPSPSPPPPPVEFLTQQGDNCDVFYGNWVWDETYPLYNSSNCALLDGGFRCSENGRPDSFYTKWRWQPNDCNLPRFGLIPFHIFYHFGLILDLFFVFLFWFVEIAQNMMTKKFFCLLVYQCLVFVLWS
ncbi:unnamed protein product [Trifolium pratense]|uniref:Uncharacterized protein n=1 Tax=Trifolium pratense TaxID=57577 RepID=A0ACB0ILS9_TRIPR|nr:unnamed protein product [Trifolium pratense]